MTESSTDTDLLLRYATVCKYIYILIVSLWSEIGPNKQTHAQTQLAEITNRFDDMAKYMKQLCSAKTSITLLERNLLSIAYKSAVDSRRSSMRKLRRRNLDVDSAALTSFEDMIRKEIVTLCSEAISIARDLIEKDEEEPSMSAIERIFLIKMVGDYNRYMGEFLPKGHPCVNAALQAYSNAMKAAEGIRPSNATRLGLALNFSVFHLEVLNNFKEACMIAEGAYNSAGEDLEGLSEKEYRNTSMIMELIGDNIALWKERDNKEGKHKDGNLKNEGTSTKGDGSSNTPREQRASSDIMMHSSPQRKKLVRHSSSDSGSSTPPPIRS